MNKKDVLGASAAAGNVQKMESTPHGCECRKCSKYDTQQGKGRREILVFRLLSDKVSTSQNDN